MASVTNLIVKPRAANLTSTTNINLLASNFNPQLLSLYPKSKHLQQPRTETVVRSPVFIQKATAVSRVKNIGSNTDERVQQVHSINEFDEALRKAKNKLVVVEYAASHSKQSSKIYPFMVNLSRTCSDVEFLLVMGDESEDTRELCRREKIEKVQEHVFTRAWRRFMRRKGFNPMCSWEMFFTTATTTPVWCRYILAL